MPDFQIRSQKYNRVFLAQDIQVLMNWEVTFAHPYQPNVLIFEVASLDAFVAPLRTHAYSALAPTRHGSIRGWMM